jgi:hypothetical protein
MDWPGYALPRYIAMDCPILLHVEVKWSEVSFCFAPVDANLF